MENTPEFETEYDTLDPLSPARNGKIAALSRNIREALNRRIRHGQPGLDILEWLNAEPSVVAILEQRFEGKPITRHNLFEWRHGGYKEWARHRAARIRLQRKQKEGKGIDRHQLGEEMAQLYAEELTDTLDELIDFAPDPEVRMQRLEQGLNQIRGWRRSDYHAQRMMLQTERMALDKEKLQWRSQCQTQELDLKRQRLELDREKDTRNTCEWVVKTLKDPKIQEAVYRGQKSYADEVKAVRVLMFGDDEDELNSTLNTQPFEDSQPSGNGTPPPAAEKPSGNGQMDAVQHPAPLHSVAPGCTENEKGQKGNIQHPTSNVQHPVDEGQREEGTNIQHSTLNAQHSTEGASTDSHEKNHGEPQLKPARASLSPADAIKYVEKLVAKVKRLGYVSPNRWDMAALIACLSGQPAQWYSIKTFKLEWAQPPAIDPRLDPASPWCKLWKYIE
jgi:hypothetical protein